MANPGTIARIRSLAFLVLVLLAVGCSTNGSRDEVAGDPRTNPTPPAQRIVLDVDYGESPEALVEASQVVVRARAVGAEKLGTVFEDNTGLVEFVQEFEVLESLKGEVAQGASIEVWRLDLSKDARANGSVLAEPVVPPFEDGGEYVLLLVRAKGEEPYHIAGYLTGALVVRDGMLDTTYEGEDVPSIVKELRGMTWEELDSLASEA